MSRLQVGGLALIIKAGVNDLNVGKVVELVEHVGPRGKNENVWFVKGEVINEVGYIIHEAYIEQDRLIPLGDKQTQDEFKKELDFCHEN